MRDRETGLLFPCFWICGMEVENDFGVADFDRPLRVCRSQLRLFLDLFDRLVAHLCGHLGSTTHSQDRLLLLDSLDHWRLFLVGNFRPYQCFGRLDARLDQDMDGRVVKVGLEVKDCVDFWVKRISKRYIELV